MDLYSRFRRNFGFSGLAGEGVLIPLKQIEYGAYGNLVIIYPNPYSIYLWGILRL